MKKLVPYFIILMFVFIGCSDDEGDLIVDPAPEAQDCGATNNLVGESRELQISSAYGISGTVTIISDCEIEFSNFFYNGLGPNVSIYGGKDGDFRSGVNLSASINGRSFEGETFSVFLPKNKTLEDINSFSVWCFQFDIDFSSASFQ